MSFIDNGGMVMFILFAGDQHYPCGGWNDYRGMFSTLDEAIVAGKQRLANGCDWAHVVNYSTRAVTYL